MPSLLSSAVVSGRLAGADVARLVFEVAEAMRFVHSRGVVHRDLKPSNVLIGSDGHVRVSDFGIATLMSAEEQSTTLGGGTQRFMAPELLNEEAYDAKADVYSFGVLLFFVLSGGEMPRITLVQVGTGKKAAIPAGFTDAARRLVDACWSFDPRERPSFADIVRQLDECDYRVVDLSDEEAREVRHQIEEEKKRLPK